MKQFKPLTYYIADYAKQNNSICAHKELSENEYESLIKMLSALTVFRNCFNIKEMFLETEIDIIHYFNTLSSEVIPPDYSVITPSLITANKLLMNYLSFLIIIKTGKTIHEFVVETLPIYYLDLFFRTETLFNIQRLERRLVNKCPPNS